MVASSGGLPRHLRLLDALAAGGHLVRVRGRVVARERGRWGAVARRPVEPSLAAQSNQVGAFDPAGEHLADSAVAGDDR
jgi:hypothetical protein